MSLVSQNKLDEWFQTDSWVYKNFAYLFQNPWWTIRVPKGFSACPYFHFAMFGLCVVRPFIYCMTPFLHLMKGLVRIGGTPFAKFDSFMRKRVFPKLELPVGIGLLLTLLLALATGVCACALWVLFDLYMIAIYGSLTANLILGASAISLGVLTACEIYIQKNMHVSKKDRCKVEYYLFAWFFIMLGGMLLFNYKETTASLAVSGQFSIGLIKFFGIIAVELIKIIGWAIGFVVVWFFKILWFCLKFLGGLIALIALFSIASIPVIAWLFLLSCLGGLMMKIGGNVSVQQTQKVNRERKVTRDDWESLIRNCYESLACHNMLYRIVELAAEENKKYMKQRDKLCLTIDGGSRSTTTMASRLFDEVIRQIEIPNQLLTLPYHDFNALRKRMHKNKKSGYSGDLWEKLYTDIREFNKTFPQYINKISRSLKKYIDWHYLEREDTNVQYLMKFYKKNLLKGHLEMREWDIHTAEQKAIELKKKTEKNSKRNELCQKITGAISQFFGLVFYPFIVLGIGIQKTGRGIKFVGKNLLIFCLYTWMLIKSAKHGVCPYMVFSDPVEDVPVDPTNPTGSSDTGISL